MVDVTICNNDKCPLKDICARYKKDAPNVVLFKPTDGRCTSFIRMCI